MCRANTNILPASHFSLYGRQDLLKVTWLKLFKLFCQDSSYWLSFLLGGRVGLWAFNTLLFLRFNGYELILFPLLQGFFSRSLLTIEYMLACGCLTDNNMWHPTQEGFSLRLYISVRGTVVANKTKHSDGSEWFKISPSGCVISPKRIICPQL